MFCVKFQREMPGLDEVPFDNPVGQRIYDNVSLAAWKLWLEQMKMIMNEYRLNLGTTEAQPELRLAVTGHFLANMRSTIRRCSALALETPSAAMAKSNTSRMDRSR